jgi:hypothetical protein
LNGTCLNPKFDLTLKEVCEADIEEVFGKMAKFKTTNIQLHVNTKKKLLELCCKIYGTSIVTNNKFMSWMVKGYIAQAKGYNVNWARAVALIAKENEPILVVKKMKGTKSLDVSKLSGGLEVSWKIEGGDVCKSFIVAIRFVSRSTCPDGVLAKYIAMVQDLYFFLGEMFKSLR